MLGPPTAGIEDPAASFSENGCRFPIDILSEEETSYYRTQLIGFLDKMKWKLDAINRHKPHMYLKWANDLGRHPRLLSSVVPILGPNILLWYSVIFVKPPRTTSRVPWHQDSTYWAMNKEEGLTCWIALSDVNEANGCMKVIPGSHRGKDFKHRINNRKDNLLHRGQEIAGIEDMPTTPVVLRPGQASLHDLRLLHMSDSNPSDQPRLGIAFRYIPTSNFPRTLKWLKRTATLVHGEDTYRHFAADPVPSRDFDPAALREYRRSLRVAAIHTLFGDTSRGNMRKALDTVPILISRKTADYFKYWRHLAE